MTRLFPLCFLLLATVIASAKKDLKSSVKLPLTPVPADSIIVQDFFWHGQQQEAFKAHPNTEAVRFSEKRLSSKKIKKLSAAWVKKIQHLDACGYIKTESDKSKLQSAIDLAEESAYLAWATGDARYADVMSRALYNGVCGWQSEKSTDGEKAAQTLAGIAGYALATSDEHVYINMYIRSEARIKTEKLDFNLITMTSTPWYYQTILQFKFNEKKQQHIVFHFRLPEWLKKDAELTLPNYMCKTQQPSYAIMLNGNRLKPKEENGYLVIDELLCDTDIIGIQMPAPIIRIFPKDDPSKVILQKGPLIYSFINMPKGMALREKDAYHSEFDKHRHTNVLSGAFYDKGQHAGRFTAEPFLFNRKLPESSLWPPIKP